MKLTTHDLIIKKRNIQYGHIIIKYTKEYLKNIFY
jgi:hypothetical protein